MLFQLALDAIRDAKDHLDSVDPTFDIAGIAPCSVEDLQRLQHGVRAALAQLRDMESLYTGEADLQVSVSKISRTMKTRKVYVICRNDCFSRLCSYAIRHIHR